ncbi:putative LPS assembly protein LptD [Nonlabens marinus]|uniref:LPS-assembly protein LptD central domain-containing protein n=1 Tax=Nonlabens marinus S1-08 TaxID=1454201 RepID=W8VSV7_9FLAO|nr:putative LPS assembly protein LptD [Nonlabens marinus]BAO56550.1 hypothetical protein NMS_2541 [Nonlabens marinus S1-08]
MYSQELPITQRPIPKVVDTPTTEVTLPAEEAVQLIAEPAQDTTKPKAFLQYKLESNALGYSQLDRKKNIITLYDQALIIYGDIKLEAGKIIIDNNTGDVYAYGIVEDSTGNYVQKPVFTQGANVVEPDSIIFNKNTKKALTYNSKTAQGEFNVVAEITKKVNDSVFFMRNARFTTSKNPENPEYYFLARKIKFVPKKKIVTGLVNMYIADVPTPLGLPFAFFPMTTERRSGIIIPSFGNNNNQGYFLQNGGYYFAVNDYVDLTLLGDYFTNGSYGARVESNYRKRYKYNGSVRFLYEVSIQSERGFSDFRKSGRYNLNWQHSQDPNSNPNSRFSASVNLGSPDFYRNSFNQTNQSATLINNLSSSISYTKTFPGEPQVNLNTTVSVNQNVNTSQTTMKLPNFQGSVSRVYPFEPKVGAKKGIIENINLQYTVNAENTINSQDTEFFGPGFLDQARAGVQHTIPVATNFKIGYFSVSGNANYEETWVFDTVDQTSFFDENGTVRVQRDTINGFDSYRTYNYGASIGTTVYGQWNSKNKDSKVQAIRHILRPSVSYTANPSFDQYYERLLDESGEIISDEERFFSRFEGSIYSAPGRIYSSSLGFSVQNTLEAKVKDPENEDGELKKVQWIKSLNFDTAYNLAGDSLNWSPLNIRGVVPVFKDVDLQLNATLDPYALDNSNQRIDRFNIENGGSPFRLTNAGARFNFKLSNKDFIKGDSEEELGKVENETLRNGGRADDLFGDPIDPADGVYYEEEPAVEQEVDLKKSRYNFELPWTLNFAYTLNYNNTGRQNAITGNSIMVSGDLELSPRWSVGGNTGYDFVGDGISFTTIRFQRDLESFRMSFNWNPIGVNNSWFFFIGIKAGALSDIKYDQRKQPDPRF